MGGTADIDWPPAPIASEAYDPSRHLPAFHVAVAKRISGPIKALVSAGTMPSPKPGSEYATAGISWCSERCGSVADPRTGAAGRTDASPRLAHEPRCERRSRDHVRAGAAEIGLDGGPQSSDRLSPRCNRLRAQAN